MTITGLYAKDPKPYKNPTVAKVMTIGELKAIMSSLSDEAPVYCVTPVDEVARAAPCHAEVNDVNVFGPSITRRALLLHVAILKPEVDDA